MTYVQYPYQVLSELGQNLSDVSTRLDEKQHGATDCNGLGSDGQCTIQDAINHFRSEWKTSISNLVEDIGRWGGLSKAIGDMVDQFDTQTAMAMSQTGSFSSSAP
jgi:hypothetical protein